MFRLTVTTDEEDEYLRYENQLYTLEPACALFVGPGYREMVLVQARAGRVACELAAELVVSEATIHR